MCERSITSPSPQTAVPAQLCPPPRTATRSSCSRAKRNATTTSFLSAQNATKEGRRSIRPFQTFEPRRIWCRLARRADHAVVHEGPQLHQGESVVSSWLLSLFRQCRRLTPSPPLTAVSILLRPMSTMRARPRAPDRETHGPVPL